MKGSSPPLPAWRGNVGEALIRGAKSSGVILSYLAPSIILFFALGIGDRGAAAVHLVEVAAALLLAMVFPPVVIPALPLIAYRRWPWFALARQEVVVLSVLSLATILLLPSAFLRVAATGRYRSAFQVGAAFRLVAKSPRSYAEAWILSLTVSAVAVITVPLTPWLLFWSYLVILHAFLQVLWQSDERRRTM